MELDKSAGCGLAVILVLVALVLIGMVMVGGENRRQDAKAQRIRAEAEVIRARAELEHQRQESWESRFIMWTTALKAFSADGLMILLVVLLAIAVGFLASDVVTSRIRKL